MKKVRNLLAITVMLLVLIAETVRGQSALDGFDPNANGFVLVVVVQPDGKIVIGGFFSTLSPNGGVVVPRNHIARLKTARSTPLSTRTRTVMSMQSSPIGV
jgi:hypothetical protein